MLHLNDVATSIRECTVSKNFHSRVEYIAAARTRVALFLLQSTKAGAFGSGKTLVLVKSIIAVRPWGVAAGGGGGTTTGELIVGGTTS